METATGETFEFFAVNSRTAAAEALRGETVDFVVSGPAEYVVINKLTRRHADLIGLGRPDYHCAIVVRADSGINTIAGPEGQESGLRRHRLDVEHALPDAGAGRPWSLIQSMTSRKSHTSRNIAHEALKSRRRRRPWLERRQLAERVRNKETDLPYGFFKMLGRSGDLPNDMIMVGAHVPEAAALKVRDAILENKAQHHRGHHCA